MLLFLVLAPCLCAQFKESVIKGVVSGGFENSLFWADSCVQMILRDCWHNKYHSVVWANKETVAIEIYNNVFLVSSGHKQ